MKGKWAGCAVGIGRFGAARMRLGLMLGRLMADAR